MPNWMTNFALILFILLLITGAVTLADKLVFSKRRAEDEPEPWWIEYPKSFFPVILIVFFLRSFLVEPFKIPSSSMRPTLEVGDFILVNKFTYGIRLPIIEKKIIEINQPQRGDVLVFRYPLDPSLDYIKRVVGVPGDEVVYKDKQLIINGQAYPIGVLVHQDEVAHEQRRQHRTRRNLERLDQKGAQQKDDQDLVLRASERLDETPRELHALA